jgi:DNA primase
MAESIFEKVKASASISDVVERFAGIKLNSRNMACCPFHTEKTPSFSVKESEGIWHCFGCSTGGDAIEFVARMKGVEALEAAKIIADEFNIPYDEKPIKAKLHKTDIKKYLTDCIRNIAKIDYFKKRGLTDDTIKRFFLGYDTSRQCVVIPYSSKLQYYQSRSVIDKKFFKPKTEEAGPEPIYNKEVLSASGREPVFVVESPICAMSIAQCGGQAVALCGTGISKLLAEVTRKKFNKTLILCFDNDEPGRKASQELANLLFENNIKFDIFNIADSFKDPNELLVADPARLIENIVNAKESAKKKYLTAKDSFDAAELQNEKIDPPDWIVKDILPTGLALLCAPSKIGKSWMVLQLCLNITAEERFLNFETNKHACLYYALEDSKARLKDRMNKILKGKPASKNLHFAIKADSINTGLLDKISEELKRYPDIKLVVIDTFQKVRDKAIKNESLYSTDYREMGGLKDFADKNKICLLLVHHLRKMADESDVFNMISGSTALMGAADSIFIIYKKKRSDESAQLQMIGRDIQQDNLVIHFNKVDYIWEVEGTEKEIEERREREEYETNIYIRTIKELVKRNPISGWCGSAQDLMKAAFDITGQQNADTTNLVGKIISKYEYRLYCDGIEHKVSRSKKREHTFIKKSPYISAYQKSIYND